MNNLLPDEIEIENDIENLIKVSPEKQNKINSLLDKAKKNRAISLRIANYDLEKIKEKATKEGIPYQTLINSIVHKYVTNQLCEKNEMMKTMRMMKSIQGTSK